MNTPAPVPRSSFVTVLAWLMIAFGAFGLLMSLMQSLLLSLVAPGFDAIVSLPGPIAFPLGFFRAAMLFSIGFTAFMTYGAWALLRRRNWARILFIVLFILSAIAHVIAVAGFFVGMSLVGSLPIGGDLLPPELESAFRAMAIAIAVFMVAMAVGYVWLARRLCSPAIAAEFTNSAATR